MFFDDIIVPSEGDMLSSDGGEHIVLPIRVLDPEDVWDRVYARSRLAVQTRDGCLCSIGRRAYQ